MSFWDILFPKRCMGCGSFGGYICSDCLGKIAVRDEQKCPVCEKPSLSGLTHARCKLPLNMDGLTLGFEYRGLVRKMITKFKLAYVSEVLPDLMELWISLADLNSIVRYDDWLVTSVPLHPSRLRYRGYNQAALLGQAIAKYLGYPYQEILLRTSATVPNSKLSRKKRLENIKGKFAVIDKKVVKGHKILLVDDIWTTGTTMRECGLMLKRSGADLVWGATLSG